MIEHGALQPRQLVSELDAIEAALAAGYRDAPASPVAQAVKAFPEEQGYPSLPGECWEDVVAEGRETISEAITRLRSRTAGSDG